MTDLTTSKSSKLGKFINNFIQTFNFCFFLATALVWIYFTAIKLATEPFQIGLLWDGFNQMYGQFSVKVGCIMLVVFNGLQTIRLWINDYHDLQENVGHLRTIKKIFKKKSA
jgi:hypothetical protein